MKVLLTGATGLIGGEIAGRLIGLGHEVVAVSRRREGRRLLGTQTVCLDFRGAVLADWLGHLADIDAVVNCVGVLQGNFHGFARGRACARPGGSLRSLRGGGRPTGDPLLGGRCRPRGAVFLLGEQGSGGRGSAGTRSRLGDPATIRRSRPACLRSERALPRPCDLAAPAASPGRWTSPGGAARGRRGDRRSPARGAQAHARDNGACRTGAAQLRRGRRALPPLVRLGARPALFDAGDAVPAALSAGRPGRLARVASASAQQRAP